MTTTPDRAGSELAGGRRLVIITLAAIGVAVLAALTARVLTRAIYFVTNLAFYQRASFAQSGPAGHHLGAWVVLVPVAGAVVVGLMARFGSAAIRGHGIPESMECVLRGESRIPARLTLLKPLSAAISIGTGGPFGAEGPIIATGSALGSLFGQLAAVTNAERKTLLAAGAAAGMAATFGTPIAAVFIAVELLLFELRPRSLVPVTLASVTAAAVRAWMLGVDPVFRVPDLAPPTPGALACYAVVGALTGVAAVGVTRAVYSVEEWFEKLPVHWMWWPAIGAVAVGVIGYVEPHTLGVGYDNIEHALAGSLTLRAIAVLCGLKLVSWAISLGSGTSGGTLAPLMTVGAGVGTVAGAAMQLVLPHAHVDLRMAALVGMASMFAGASRAALTSAIFAFEATHQIQGVLPVLAGCLLALLVSLALMRHTIMTEKIAKRGVRVVGEYRADPLEEAAATDHASRPVTLRDHASLGEVRAFLRSGADGSRHATYPVLDAAGALAGLLSRHEVTESDASDTAPVGALLSGLPATCPATASLAEAAHLLTAHEAPCLCVVDASDARALVGVLTRGDVLRAHRRRVEEGELLGEASLLRSLRRQIAGASGRAGP